MKLVGAALDAALAGVVVGLADVALVASRSGLAPTTAVIVVGLTALAVTVVGTPAVLVLRRLAHHPIGRPLAARLREPGPRRVEALAAIAIAVSALAAVWLFGYHRVAYGHARYRVASGAGLTASTQIVAVGIVLAILATAAGPPLARWLAGRRVLQIATTGRLGLGVAISTAVGVAIAIDATLGVLVPAFDPPPAYVLVTVPIMLAVVAATAPSARLPRRVGAIAGGAIAAVAVIALFVVGRADQARGALAAHGATSRLVLRELHAVTDGDGDGFSDRFGGADCDDGDARVHRGATEHADNGKDDNCAAGDLPGAALADRRAAHPSATPDAPRRDIVLVTIDTVRADRTSAYGYARDTTPVLAALAARGARFLRAQSPAPMTRWAIPSLLFGRYTSTLPYRGGRGGEFLEPHQLPTVASTLRDAGYATAAVVAYGGLFRREVLVGFDDVVRVGGETSVRAMRDNASAVADAALAWLAARPADRPVFLWIHYVDPHAPYEPPDAAPRFGDDDAYDRGVAWADRQLGRVVDGARAHRGDELIVAVTSDHGEAFGDHGTRFHARSLYEHQTRVPLVISVPGVTPRNVAAPVSLVDVGPTLLDVVGVTAPAGMNGRSLAAALRGGAEPAHDVLAELFRGNAAKRNLLALHRGDEVVIRDLDAGTMEVYDLARDPGQLRDLAGGARARELTLALDAAVDRELGALEPAP